jgi:hypothetical protein
VKHGLESYLIVLGLVAAIGVLWRLRRRGSGVVLTAPQGGRVGPAAALTILAGVAVIAVSGRVRPSGSAATPAPRPVAAPPRTVTITREVTRTIAAHPWLSGADVTVMWIAAAAAVVAVVFLVGRYFL